MNIPVVLLTYNRTNLLEQTLIEHERVNTPKLIIVDDGSEKEKINFLKTHELCSKHTIIFSDNYGYKKQFLKIMTRFNQSDFYVFVEDDVIYSINWYQWGVRKLDELVKQGRNVGVFALYTGHPQLKEQVLPGVYKHNDEHFYGTCCLFINPKIRKEYKYYSEDNGWNPDLAIREMSLNNSKFELFVAAPTLAQHIGDSSLLNANPHRSPLFWGKERDASCKP